MLEGAPQSHENATRPTSCGQKKMESCEGTTKSSLINGESSELADDREKTESLGGSATLDCVHGAAQSAIVVHTTMALTNSAGKPDTMLPQGLSKNIRSAQGANGNGQIWRKAKKQLVSACLHHQ